MWRVREREQITVALGVVNLGWLALPWWWWTRRDPRERRWAGALLGLAALSALFWCAVMWGPYATVTTHSAYVLDTLLFVALGAALAALPLRLALAVLALAAADLVVTWVVGSLGDAWRSAPAVDPVMALLAVAAAVACGAVLVLDGRTAAAE
jgi:peptidoglycan/LPS O-acetylase OafA/YrhL